MGLFINTPPVRVTIDPAAPVIDLLEAVRAQQVDKRAHEHTALSDIQAMLGRPGRRRCSTPSSSSTSCTRAPASRRSADRSSARDFDLHDQTNFPLTLLAYLDPQVHFKLSYDRRRFDAAAMRAGAASCSSTC